MLESAVFQITYKCNSECGFCLNSYWNNRSQPELSFDEKKYIIYRLFESGISQIIFSGGEPLADRNCAELIRFALSLGLNVYVQTNGLLITKNFLEKINNAALIQVSLEGGERIHNEITKGNFKRTVESIKLIKSMGMTAVTNFTVTKKNMHCLEPYIQLIEGLGVDIANFTRLYPAGRALVNYKELMPGRNEFIAFLRKLEGLKDKTNVKLNIQGPTPLCLLKTNDINLGTNSCAAGRTEICVMPNGMISLCPSWPEPFGTIDDIDKITGINIRKRLPEKCCNCEYLESCGGACILACTKEGDIYSERISEGLLQIEEKSQAL